MPSSHSPAQLKKDIRQKIRAQRRALTEKEKQIAQMGFSRQLHRSQLLLRAKHIGLYFGHDGELDPSLLLNQLAAYGKRSYSPVIASDGKQTMEFHQYRKDGDLRPNRFGIPEPNIRVCKRLPANMLSLVLMPLVAFDKVGNRLGMGGGYYDRLFANANMNGKRPLLIGVAYEFQKVPALPKEAWDVPIDGVLTDRHFYRFSR